MIGVRRWPPKCLRDYRMLHELGEYRGFAETPHPFGPIPLFADFGNNCWDHSRMYNLETSSKVSPVAAQRRGEFPRLKEFAMAARKRPVRKHEVRAELSNFSLAKAKSALTLQVYAKGEKVGELQIGRGSLYWWGRNKQNHKRVSWGSFTKMMNELAYGR